MQSIWLEKIKRWVRRLTEKKKKRYTSNPILKRWDSQTKDCAVLQLERNVPGAIATYRIISKYGDCDYLITLDYLPDVQAQLKLEKQLSIKFSTSFRVRQSSPFNPRTHRFGIFQIFPNGKTCPVEVWDVNLEGNFTSFALSKSAPLRAIRYVALQSLVIVHAPQISLSWQFQIEEMDWIRLLEYRMKGELLNPKHNLNAVKITDKNTI